MTSIFIDLLPGKETSFSNEESLFQCVGTIKPEVEQHKRTIICSSVTVLFTEMIFRY